MKQELNSFPTIDIDASEILLHSCCAPCAAEMMLALQKSNLEVCVLFYNPNIHPKVEYEIRKNENKRYADKLKMEFVDLDYSPAEFYSRTKGLEFEPERGARCTICFDHRFQVSAKYAADNDFKYFTSSLGISRWKDFEQITACGIKAASNYPPLSYYSYNWRKNGGSQRMIEISKDESFYQQQYCGCSYSLRDTNRYRKSNGRTIVGIGENFYQKAETRKSEN